MQSAVLVNPETRKPQSVSEGRAPQVSLLTATTPPELPYLHSRAVTWALRLSLRAATARAASTVLLVCREDHHTPLFHAASLKIKAAWPKEKAALVSGACESSGPAAQHLFPDSRNSRDL